MSILYDPINVPLSQKVLEETEWHNVTQEIEGDTFTEAFISLQLPGVVMARMEFGMRFVYEEVRYDPEKPDHMEEFFRVYNRDKGFLI